MALKHGQIVSFGTHLSSFSCCSGASQKGRLPGWIGPLSWPELVSPNELEKREFFGANLCERGLNMEIPVGTPRRSYRHNNLPNALRAAARAILDEDSPDMVGLRETARRVGVSATAAYRHFNNKEDLLASVAAEGFGELFAAMETGATDSDPLRGVGLAYVDFALQKRGLFRLMFGPILVERTKIPQAGTKPPMQSSICFSASRSAPMSGTHEGQFSGDGGLGPGSWLVVAVHRRPRSRDERQRSGERDSHPAPRREYQPAA